MSQIIKINVVSMLYALFISVPLELMVNVYRISRLTGWDIGTVNNLSSAIYIAELVLGTIAFYLLTKNWLGTRKSNYFTVILWVPYLVLFIYIFASLFPMTYEGDDPNPVSGLLAMGALILFPIYILIINFICTSKIFRRD